MIVAEKENYINGSNAMELEKQYIEKQREVHKENQNNEKQRQNKVKEHQNINKAEVVKCIVALFAVGMLLVNRYSMIYANELEIRQIKNQITNLSNESDQLKIKVAKYQDINEINRVAKEEIGMEEPSKVNVIYSDSNSDFFAEDDKIDVEEEDSFLSRLKQVLF